MNIDEAIERENALAYSYGERYKRLGEPVGDLQELEAEHEQYAEWLRELKAYKANREGYCNWCSNLKDRHLRIEYYWIDDEGNTASYVGKTNQVATGIARFCPCCGRFIEMEVNADE